MSMEFTLNELQRRRVEDHLALVEQVLRRSIKTNETVDGMGHDDLYQEGCIALCRAAVSYREEMGAFPAYARTVIRNYDGFHHAVCFLPGCRWEDIVGFSDAEIQEYQKVIESSAEQIMHLAASSKG